MTIKEVRHNAFEKYKRHRLNSWVLSIICGLFIAALLLGGILSEVFLLLIIPFVVLPFLFACIVAHFGLQARDELSGKALFKLFSLYYRNPFNHSFGVVRSFFKAVLIELVASLIFTGVMYTIYANSPTFIDSINEFIELLRTNALTTENMQELLDRNNGELSNFINLTNGISFLVASLSFVVFVTREAITIYTRLSLRDVPLANQIARATMRVNYKHFNMAFFALNWPLYALIILGMTIGMLVSIFAFDNYVIAPSVGLSSGIALATLYLPFYFANLEAIFDYLTIDIESLSEEYVKEVFQRYGVNIEVKEVKEENKNDPSNEDRNE